MPTPTVASKNEVLRSPDGLVDLITVDCSNAGGSVYHISPQCYADGTELVWGGQAFQLCPVGINGFETKSISSDIPRPTLFVGNGISGILLAPVTALGDIVGATVTYVTTYASYLDAGSNPDTTQYAARGVWRIAAKTQESNQSIQFDLASPLDLPGMMFPVRQILIYPGINPPDGIYFPGVSPFRNDQYQSQ